MTFPLTTPISLLNTCTTILYRPGLLQKNSFLVSTNFSLHSSIDLLLYFIWRTKRILRKTTQDGFVVHKHRTNLDPKAKLAWLNLPHSPTLPTPVTTGCQWLNAPKSRAEPTIWNWDDRTGIWNVSDVDCMFRLMRRTPASSWVKL